MHKKGTSAQTGKAPTSSNQNILKPTPEIEEGPYYKPNSPQKNRLREEGMPGEKLTLSGYVRDIHGKPVAHAWLDFWQANSHGRYDNAGYTLRGHQFTNNEGKYSLETIVPGGYNPRTPHIHAKIRANNNSPILTVQLFIPGLDSNKTDFLFRDDLLMEMKETTKGKIATFNIVLKEPSI
jgi:protocatechuate 3,4-dioxygenase beta subunit